MEFVGEPVPAVPAEVGFSEEALGEAPKDRLAVGLEVGEPERVEVLVEEGDRPTLNEEVGVVVGLEVKDGVEVEEGLAPVERLGV